MNATANKNTLILTGTAKKEKVIPSQCAHWRGNLLFMGGDCHTSDTITGSQ